MADRLNEVIGRLRAEADRDAFGTQLIEALEMADTEEDAYRVLARAMKVISTTCPPSCCWPIPVERTWSRRHSIRMPVPGMRRGVSFQLHGGATRHPVIFPDSEALNACSRLRGRACARSPQCVSR